MTEHQHTTPRTVDPWTCATCGRRGTGTAPCTHDGPNPTDLDDIVYDALDHARQQGYDDDLIEVSARITNAVLKEVASCKAAEALHADNHPRENAPVIDACPEHASDSHVFLDYGRTAIDAPPELR